MGSKFEQNLYPKGQNSVILRPLAAEIGILKILQVYWGWLYIDLLWIKDELRGRGYGHRLLTQIEDEGRKLGVQNAYLDTFSFQVPDFYKDHGYQAFGELQDFPPGHQRYFMKKEL